jgi:signal transduction histidine kinase
VDETEYHDLQERAQDVRAVLSHQSADLTLQQIQQEFAMIYEWKDDGKFLQIRDEQARWLFRSERMIKLNPDTPAIAALPKAGLVLNSNAGSHRIRILSYPIEVRGKHYLVQTGISLQKPAALLANFRIKLLLLMPIVILLAALGGHHMSRKALKPIAVLASETRRINERSLNSRLPEPETRDEISDLSRTLNQMLERIDKAFASVRTFTGNASHELRTPISLLRTEIEVALYQPPTTEEYHSILKSLHQEAVRMTRLVEDLLSLARSDGGAETITLSPIRVDDLFRHAKATWTNAMDRAMLDFTTEAAEKDLVLIGDSQGIPRLLSILLDNASKFTPPGGSVKLSAEVAGSRIVVSVIDTGVGIAAEHLPRIFDRFYRAASGSNSVRMGSGLGLALAKWIAERHGTELNVTSHPGRGSCFTLSLERTHSEVLVVPCINPMQSQTQLGR